MTVTARDKRIINDLNRFRVMDRDSIAELHFKGLKNPKYAANNVLLRLLREGHIQRSTAFVPYVYFGPEVNMKKNSVKTGHFLAILNVYREIISNEKIEVFLVEPKYGPKGTVEPDIFCIIRGTPFFIEVQKTIYSDKQMKDKLNRYVALYQSRVIEQESWQTAEKTVFPHVLILSEQRYGIDMAYPFKVMQAASFSQFMNSIRVSNISKATPTIKSNLKIKVP